MAELVHLSLFLSITEIVSVLHADEFRPAVLFRDELHTSKLIRPHRACSDVMNLASLHEVVKRFHGLFRGYRGIVSMDLEKVNVIGSQTLERSIDSFKDCAAR